MNICDEKTWKMINDHLMDDLSKKIFANRILFNITSDKVYLHNIVMLTEEGKQFYSMIDNSKDKILFGAGTWGKRILETYQDRKYLYFVDNNAKRKDMFCGLSVVSFPEFLDRYDGEQIIISARLSHNEIYHQLLDAGILQENIVNAGEILTQMISKEYFDLPELMMNDEQEYFVDGGTLDGKTIEYFVQWKKRKYNKIWGFEPDKKNAINTQNYLTKKHLQNVEILPFALWDKKETLSFAASQGPFSKITDEGEEKIEAISLDDVIDERVTFIKMDIEGAELNALKGASNIIKKYKPKLAICIYHKSEDIWEIPKYILQLNNKYKLYIRHYSLEDSETVLYAINETKID